MTACQQRPLFLSPEGGDLTVCRFFSGCLETCFAKRLELPLGETRWQRIEAGLHFEKARPFQFISNFKKMIISI